MAQVLFGTDMGYTDQFDPPVDAKPMREECCGGPQQGFSRCGCLSWQR